MVSAFVVVLAQITNVHAVPALTTDDEVQVEWLLQFIPLNVVGAPRGGMVAMTGFRIYYQPSALGALTSDSVHLDYAPNGSILAGDSFGCLVPGLVDDTPYTFGVVCLVNATEAGAIATMNYTTAPDNVAPSPIMLTLAPQDTTETSVRATWTSAGDDLMAGGPVDHTVIAWAPHPIGTLAELTDPLAVTDFATIQASDPGTPMSITVTGLAPDTDYWVAAAAYDNSGNPSTLAVSSARTLAWGTAVADGGTKKKSCATSGTPAACGLLLALMLPLALKR